ncbi:hypothetical protein [Streptomyces sp. bgisy126]|uniref:hypothetical protein n=1 Tax=unclassified Streptomyces TaxID=2593676 RepID=UPI003EBBEB21
MRRRPLLFILALIVLVGAGAALAVVKRTPADGSGEPVTMAQLMAVLPRGKDVPGYRAVFQRPEIGADSPGRSCGEVASALWSRDRMPLASTLVVLTPTKAGQDQHYVTSHSYARTDAQRIMQELRASVPACAHYNSYHADLYLRFGTRPAKPQFDVGDEVVSYRVLAPPAGHPDLGGSGIPLQPGPLQEPGALVTFVRTGGVITAYGGTVPKAIADDFDARLRRAPTAGD